jgi:hypothetical protein
MANQRYQIKGEEVAGALCRTVILVGYEEKQRNKTREKKNLSEGKKRRLYMCDLFCRIMVATAGGCGAEGRQRNSSYITQTHKSTKCRVLHAAASHCICICICSQLSFWSQLVADFVCLGCVMYGEPYRYVDLIRSRACRQPQNHLHSYQNGRKEIKHIENGTATGIPPSVSRGHRCKIYEV